jgi:O-antigen/teichoic acid export membrane protein
VAFEADDRVKVRRGAAITLLGRLSGLANGLFVFVAKFLFGSEQFGLYMLAFFVVDLISRFVVSGFADAITYFASRHVAARREEQMYQAMAICLLWPVGLSLVLALALGASVDLAYDAWWAAEYPTSVKPLLQLMAWGLPLTVLVRLPVEAVKAHMDMKWATIVDICLPLLMFGLAVVFAFTGAEAGGLALAWMIAHGIAGSIALYGFARYFDLGKLAAAIRRPGESGEILAFAIPQSLNMMFNFGLVRVDGIMLSAWYGPEVLAVYGVVSELVRSIRAAKMAFVGVFAPLVAKYRELDNVDGIRDSLNEIARFIATAAVPISLAALFFYPEATTFTPGKDWTHSRVFPWLLAVGPVLSCYFGLAGNLLLMSGYSRLLLVNSTVAIIVNVVLNALWIPEHGMLGAAAATMTSGLVLSVLQMIEIDRFVGVRFRPSNYLKPTVGMLLVLGVGLWVNGEAGNAWIYAHGVLVGLVLKTCIGLAVLGAFAGVVLGWPGHNPEKAWVLDQLARWRARNAT